MGVVERAEGSECCLAQCHVFQCEQNKSICEVAAGAECTFATGECYVCRVPTCYCVCLCLLVPELEPEPAWWLAGWSQWHLGSLAGEPCYYQSLVTHRRDQKCIRLYSSFQISVADGSSDIRRLVIKEVLFR